MNHTTQLGTIPKNTCESELGDSCPSLGLDCASTEKRRDNFPSFNLALIWVKWGKNLLGRGNHRRRWHLWAVHGISRVLRYNRNSLKYVR